MKNTLFFTLPFILFPSVLHGTEAVMPVHSQLPHQLSYKEFMQRDIARECEFNKFRKFGNNQLSPAEIESLKSPPRLTRALHGIPTLNSVISDMYLSEKPGETQTRIRGYIARLKKPHRDKT